jgi:hypothetical protein
MSYSTQTNISAVGTGDPIQALTIIEVFAAAVGRPARYLLAGQKLFLEYF